MDCSATSNPPYHPSTTTTTQLLHPSKNNNNYNAANDAAANCFNDFATHIMSDYINSEAMGAADDQLNQIPAPADPVWWDFGTSTVTTDTTATRAAAASAPFNIMDNLPDVDSSMIMFHNNGNINTSDQMSLFNHNIINPSWPMISTTTIGSSPLISLPLRVPDSDQNPRQIMHPNSIKDGDQMQQQCKLADPKFIHGSCDTTVNGYPSTNYSTPKINGELTHERTHHQPANHNINIRPIFQEYPLDHGPASNIIVSNSTCWPEYNINYYYSDIINMDHDLAAINQKSAAHSNDNLNSRVSSGGSLINPAANFSPNPSSTCVFPLLMSGAKNAEALVTATISDRHHHHLHHQHYGRNHGAADYNNGESFVGTTTPDTRTRNMTVHRPGQLQRASLQTNSNCSSTASNSTVISDTSSTSTALLQQSLKRPRTSIANDTVMVKPINSPSISSNLSISQPQLMNNNAIASSTVKPQVRKEKVGDRITILQQLVSPFGKTDTASVLLEAIGCIKFLQEHVQALTAPYMASNTNTRTVPNQDCKAKLSDSISSITGQQCRGEKATKSSKADDINGGGDGGDDDKLQQRQQDNMQIIDLRSRGLCLVPVTWMVQVVNDNGADYWAPSLASSTITNISGL